MPLLLTDKQLDQIISASIKRLRSLGHRPAVTEADGWDGRDQKKEAA